MENEMKLHRIALLSATDAGSVIGTIEVWAVNIKAALKRVRTDPDMAGVRAMPA